MELPDAAFLFNIGQAQRQLGQYEAAARSYRLYLANQADSPNREQVKRLIEQMDQAARDARAKEPPTAVQRPAQLSLESGGATLAVQTPPASVQQKAIQRPWYQKKTALALGAIGLAGAIAGSALLGVAGADAKSAKSATTLPNQRELNNDAGTFSIAGGVTLGVGGALMVGGLVILGVQR